ncbi:MAG: hypothetical protein AB7Q27_11715 [Acidimicrobiia bacterium]
MTNEERPGRLEPTRAQISELAGAGDDHKGTGAVVDTPWAIVAEPSEHELVELARFTCQPTFDLYLPDGSNNLDPEARRVTAEQAVESGRPYLGRTLPWVWAIDIDIDTSSREGGEVLRAVLGQLELAGLDEYFLCDSGRPGYRHVFVYEPEGAEARRALAEAVRAFVSPGVVDFRLQATGAAIRPPGAPHRFGGRSMPVDGVDEALEVLRAWWARHGVFDHDVQPGPTKGSLADLSARDRALLRNDWAEADRIGPPVPRRGASVDRSAVDISLAQSLRCIGWTREDFVRARAPGGEFPSSKALERNDPETYLGRQWDWAGEHDMTSVQRAGLARLGEFQQAFVVSNHRGLSMVARRVLSAVIAIADARGRTALNVGWREIRELTGAGNGPIGSALDELKLCGLIGVGRVASEGRFSGQATGVRLNISALDRLEVGQNSALSVTPNPVVAPFRPTPTLHHPAFWPGGLKPTGWETLIHLSDCEARSLAELEARSGVSRETLKRRLPELVAAGAVVRVGTERRPKYVANPDFDFDRYAADQGLLERQRQLELEHIEDRREFIGYQMNTGAISAREALERFGKLPARPESRPVSRSPIVANDRLIDPFTGVILDGTSVVPLMVVEAAPEPTSRHCRCCGRPSARVHPTVGLPWHDGCLMPVWVARIERRNGVEIPDDLVAPPQPAPIDPWEIDPPVARMVPLGRRPELAVAA